ncbi:hypothetical protein C8R44DRAFT_602645, partial [Mycena epipterygia]
VNLRDYCPPVYNQGQMSSCTAHAVAAAFEFDVEKQGLSPFSPSRLFIWYYAREKSTIPWAVMKDVGSTLRDAIQSLDFKVHGVCSEHDWSYQVSEADEKIGVFLRDAKATMKPPVFAQNHAHRHTASRYFTFTQPDLRNKLIQCLDKGYLFVFGMRSYGLLNRIDRNGQGLTNHKKNGEHRHSLMAVGYIQAEKVFIVRNSWGTHFGEDGYFYMPYDFLQHFYDFWTIRVVNSPRC